MTRSFRRNMGAGLIALAGSMGVASPAGAEVFRWVDTQGAMTYSNQPPPDRSLHYRKVDASVPQARGVTMSSDRVDRNAAEISTQIESLEKQIESERQARSLADQRTALTQAAYEQRLAEVTANRPAAVIPVVNGPIWVRPASGHMPGSHHHRDANSMPRDEAPGPATSGTRSNPPMQRFR